MRRRVFSIIMTLFILVGMLPVNTFATDETGGIDADVIAQMMACEHSSGLIKHAAVDPSCETAGNSEYWRCEACGACYADAAGELWIVDEESAAIPATHDYSLDEGKACSLCSATRTVNDSGTCGADVTWVLYSDGELVISGTGPMEDYERDLDVGYSPSHPWFSHASSINRLKICDGVTSIGNHAFAHLYYVESVDIASSVKTIGDNAFSNCIELSRVDIHDGVTHIGDSAFRSCQSIKTIIIPESVSVISDNMFNHCEKLISVNLLGNVSSIGDDAFNLCSNLNSIWVSEDSEFYTSVDGVIYDKDLTNIIVFPAAKSGTFIVPEGVKKIEPLAFNGCDNLTTIILSSSVDGVNGRSFNDCENLVAIEVAEENAHYTSIDGVLYNKDITEIIRCPIGRSGEFSLPESVTSIGYAAFEDCSKLTSIVMPENLERIDINTFEGCSGLTKIDIPNKVKYIGTFAFGSCSSITSITIPESVEFIGLNPFSRWSGIIEINVSESNPYYSSKDGILYNKTFTSLISCPGGKSGILVVPDGVDTIEEHAFDTCTSLTEIQMPDTVKVIGVGAFRACQGLENISIPEGVSEIGDAAFEVTGLKSVSIPKSVSTIGNSAFYSCKELTDVYYSGNSEEWDKINIGTSNYWLKNADMHYMGAWEDNYDGENHIRHCTDSCDKSQIEPHKWVAATCTEPKTCTACGATSGAALGGTHELVQTSDDKGHWDECSKCYIKLNIANHDFSAGDGRNCSVCNYEVAAIESGAYGENLTWVLYSDGYLKISGKGNMNSYMYDNVPWYPNRDSIKTVHISDGITNVGNYAFYQCKNLTDVYIPDTIKSIGDVAFWNCESLETILIPDGVTSIGEAAFEVCSNLKTVDIPSGVTAIEGSTFHGCKFESLTIPDGVTIIKEYALQSCQFMTSVVIPSSIKTIEDSAFAYSDALEDVYYGGTEAEWNAISIGADNTELTSANVHYMGAWEDSKDGTNHIRYCTDGCGKSQTAEHNWTAANCDAAKSCSDCGATSGDALGHDFTRLENDETEHWYECTVCDSEKPDSRASHSGGTATCTEKAKCVVCDVLYGAVDSTNHDYASAWSKGDNSHWHDCSRCEIKDSEAAHSFDNSCDTTCDVCAYTRSITHDFTRLESDTDEHWYECTVCSSEKPDSRASHSGGTATCTEKAQCVVCDTLYGAIDNTNHNHANTWSKDGTEHWYECSRCQDKGSAANHDYGSAGDKCIVCEYERNHMHRLTLSDTVDPTCTVAGITAHYICSGCDVWFNDAAGNDIISDKTSLAIPMLGHNFDNYVADNNATCTVDGTKTAQCVRCDATDSISDPGTATGHSWVAATCTLPSTCEHCSTTTGTALGHNYVNYICDVCGGTDPLKPGNNQSSGGGGSGASASTVETSVTKNDDGSETTTVVNDATGTVTETTKFANGDKVVVETQKSGTVKTVETRADGTKVETVTSEDGETTSKITVSDSSAQTKVTVPVANAETGQVVVIVKADGSEEIVRDSVVTEGGLSFVAEENVSVKIVDNSKEFTDVKEGFWAEDAIDFVSARELFNGTSETTFSPNEEMNRAMIAKVLHNLANNPAHTFDGSFDDVADGHWATDAIYWAAEEGIINGHTDGSYGDEESVTREQLVTMLWRFAGTPDSNHSLDGFVDASDISGYAQEAFAWANEKGIITGKPGGVLDPEGNTTRAEVATMIKRFLESR